MEIRILARARSEHSIDRSGAVDQPRDGSEVFAGAGTRAGLWAARAASIEA